MPRFIIERVVPGAGKMTADELKAMSTRSCSVISNMGPKIQWIQSYVTENKIYCVYIAPDEETVREHARLGGFPANQIAVIGRMIDPTTAES
jgi:Nickel responsive protein SCO4226-like